MPKPKKQKDIKLYLNDILKAINKIEEYIANITFNEFQKDSKTQDAVIRNLEIIGEAVKPIPINLRNKESDIPWKSYAGIRDIIAHYYFGVELKSIWETASKDLEKLKKAIEHLLSDV